MSTSQRAIALVISVLIVTVTLLWITPGSITAAEGDGPPDANVVQIHIVNSEIKLTNRGLGMCKNHAEDCPNTIVWRWIGGDPSSEETEKIVINYIKGTTEAYNCFQDANGFPRLSFEILSTQNGQNEASATVSPNCPEKSAWLYQVSCVRIDEGYEGQQCTGIAPIDPGAVIG